MTKFLYDEYQREHRKHDCKHNQPNSKESDTTVNALNIVGQPGKQRASLGYCLRYSACIPLVLMHGLLVNVEKLLFYVAVKICGDPLPVFFGRFIFHKRDAMTPNDQKLSHGTPKSKAN